MDAFFAGSKGGDRANSGKCVVDCVKGGGGLNQVTKISRV